MDYDPSRTASDEAKEKTREQNTPLAERGQRLYDRWAENQLLYDLIARASASPRKQACDQLDLSGGERVLEIGCGPGVNFEMLAEGISSNGAVVGIDYSTRMVQRAIARRREHGWENIEVVRGDASRASFEPETFDAALASLVLSVIPAAREVIQAVHDALSPGGRFVVFDARARYREGSMRLLNPLRTRFVRRTFNHQEHGVVDELRAVFERVAVVETFRAGSEYVAVAVKQPDSADNS
ncbi:methyltransferase type 11 [Halobacteriales archaeon QS_3_64_16]|nr:MAG: methyltransferase type 11 [Halobacteriales archaeon QS_3_64_16]